MLQRSALAATAVTAAIAALPVATADAAKLRQCKFLDAPTPSLVYAKGALTCSTAVRVAKASLAKVQYGNPTWTVTIARRKWRCEVHTGTVVFECRRPGSRASLREA